MYQLATEHWGQQSKSTVPLTYCRIEWFKNQCKNYFFHEGMKKFDDKEKYLLSKNINEIDNFQMNNIETSIEDKINILDVGSCYNPFSTEDQFCVTAIDIAPYSNDVIKCDFLNLQIGTKRTLSENNSALVEMPINSFDAIVFSLLLEYIPCPEKRFECCKKAYQLLKNGGLLFIATPDSKHEGANTKIINTSWKVTLAKLGFLRIRYEKLPHIHCLIFRKCFYKDAAMNQIDWKKIPKDDALFSSMKIFIPQDFHTSKIEENSNTEVKQFIHNDEELITLFNELPCEK